MEDSQGERAFCEVNRGDAWGARRVYDARIDGCAQGL